MPGLVKIIGKPQTLQTIDAFSQQRHQIDLASIITLFSSRKNLVDIAKSYGMVQTPAEEQHLRRHLLNEDNKGWWRQAQPIEPIIRHALRKATELSRELDLPVDSYWVCSGEGRKAPFEASISVSPQQITLIFHTPRPPVPIGIAPPESAPIWIVNRGPNGKVKTMSLKRRKGK